MKQKRRGFTLIELLAVIVILAIIALIAVPVIMNIISSARESAFEDTAYGLISAGEMYYANSLLENGMTNDVEFTIEDGEFVGENKLEVKGALPTNGKITVTKDGKVALAITNGAHCVTKATSESKITTVKYAGSCEYKKVLNPIINSDAECITNANETCSLDAIKAGIAVNVKVNDKEEAKTFYVVKDDSATNTLTLIMDRDIGEIVAWITKEDYLSAGGTSSKWGDYGNNNKGPITALNYLESQTESWTNIGAKNYTLIDDQGKYTIERTNARARLLTKTEGKEFIRTNSFLYTNEGKYWLSSATSEWTNAASYINSGIHGCIISTCRRTVRPVIEIPKFFI